METGLYYYGARYLDPKISRWLSGDPAVGEYVPSAPVNDEVRKQNQNLPGMGGVFNYVNLHVYHYAGNNPVKYIDPDGKVLRILVIRSSGDIVVRYTPDRNYNTSYSTNANNYINERASRYNSTIVRNFKGAAVTNVVRGSTNPHNAALSDTNREQESIGGITHPTQLANGTYNISSLATPSKNPGNIYGITGNGLLIDATQMLQDVNNENLVPDTGYMAHLTPYYNTDGCVGLYYDRTDQASRNMAEGRMSWVVMLFNLAKSRGEEATITVTD